MICLSSNGEKCKESTYPSSPHFLPYHLYTDRHPAQIGKTSKEAKSTSPHSNCSCLLSLQVFLLDVNHLLFSLIPIVLSHNDQQTSAISLPLHPLEHKNHFIPEQWQRAGTQETDNSPQTHRFLQSRYLPSLHTATFRAVTYVINKLL